MYRARPRPRVPGARLRSPPRRGSARARQRFPGRRPRSTRRAPRDTRRRRAAGRRSGRRVGRAELSAPATRASSATAARSRRFGATTSPSRERRASATARAEGARTARPPLRHDSTMQTARPRRRRTRKPSTSSDAESAHCASSTTTRPGPRPAVQRVTGRRRARSRNGSPLRGCRRADAGGSPARKSPSSGTSREASARTEAGSSPFAAPRPARALSLRIASRIGGVRKLRLRLCRPHDDGHRSLVGRPGPTSSSSEPRLAHAGLALDHDQPPVGCGALPGGDAGCSAPRSRPTNGSDSACLHGRPRGRRAGRRPRQPPGADLLVELRRLRERGHPELAMEACVRRPGTARLRRHARRPSAYSSISSR